MSRRAVWGDGFASDELTSLLAVREFSELAEGESVRFFPALRGRGDMVCRDVASRVLARAGQIEEGARKAGGGESWTSGTAKDADWLRALVADARARDRAREPRLMARFAFLTGLHPAYVWPEAEVSTSWGTTAAWIGELSRCRRALMPQEVADYLNDVLARTSHGIVLRDASLADIMSAPLSTALAAAARRRLAGSDVEVCWPRSGPSCAAQGIAAIRKKFATFLNHFANRRIRERA